MGVFRDFFYILAHWFLNEYVNRGRSAQCQGASFREAQCQGANFRDAQCQGADFRDAQCQGADFALAQCQGTSFMDTQCQGAYLIIACNFLDADSFK
jgi:uncharacterized protein YjbI with pentapeptide repeats